jgi:putative oxidoreductase
LTYIDYTLYSYIQNSRTPKEFDMDAGLLIARLVFGLLMAAHGTQKLFGWFGGYGLAGTGGFLEALGFRPGRFFAGIAAVSEVVGGLLLVAGFLGPIGPALVLAVMVVAAVTVHAQHGLFATTNGIEVPLLYATAVVTLGLTGPGSYSLDSGLGLESVWTSAVVWSVLAAGAVGGILNLGLRRTPPQVPATS